MGKSWGSDHGLLEPEQIAKCGPVDTRSVEEVRPAELLTATQTAAARNFVNEISGSRRMLAHGMLYIGKGNLAYIQEQIDQNEPDSWKGYNISYAANAVLEFTLQRGRVNSVRVTSLVAAQMRPKS